MHFPAVLNSPQADVQKTVSFCITKCLLSFKKYSSYIDHGIRTLVLE